MKNVLMVQEHHNIHVGACKAGDEYEYEKMCLDVKQLWDLTA